MSWGGGGGGGECWGMKIISMILLGMNYFETSLLGFFFTPAVSNFSLKLRWKCTENASEGSYF